MPPYRLLWTYSYLVMRAKSNQSQSTPEWVTGSAYNIDTCTCTLQYMYRISYVQLQRCQLWTAVLKGSQRLCCNPFSLKKNIPQMGDIFTLKIIRVKIFRSVKFSQFHLIREIFLTVDGYNRDKCLECSQRLSLLQGIKRARYHQLQPLIRHLHVPWGVWTATHTYSLIITK